MATSDKVDNLRTKAAAARDLELRIQDLEDEIKQAREQLKALYHNTLPDLLDAAGVDRIGVPPDGNKPGVDFVMRPYYRASLAKEWDSTRKEAAFALLKKLKAESLIKTEVSAKFPKGNLQAAKKLLANIKNLKITGASIDLAQSVHASTLTAWLREIYERGQSLGQADLDTLGATVGRYVQPKGR